MQSVTAAEAAILFLDLQKEIVPASKTLPAKKLIAHAGVLAKLAALHGIPVWLSSVARGREFAPEVTGATNAEPRPRMQTTAFADTGLVEALNGSGRRTLILSGVASEIVVQRTALDALDAGYRVHVAVDACGGISERTEAAAWQRITQAGATLTSVMTFGAELAGDFASDLGGKTLNLLYETFRE